MRQSWAPKNLLRRDTGKSRSIRPGFTNISRVGFVLSCVQVAKAVLCGVAGLSGATLYGIPQLFFDLDIVQPVDFLDAGR